MENLSAQKLGYISEGCEQTVSGCGRQKAGEQMAKKQVPLRLNEKLYDAIAAWAEDDFRSVNGQIEYLLTECVKQRKKDGKYVSEHLDEPPELNIR